MKTSKIDKFIGTWNCRDYDSSLVLEIKKIGDELKISVIDTNDNESLIIDKLVINENQIHFLLTTPSNGYTTENELVMLNNDELKFRFTHTERWQRK
jgi:hypothetical protein